MSTSGRYASCIVRAASRTVAVLFPTSREYGTKGAYGVEGAGQALGLGLRLFAGRAFHHSDDFVRLRKWLHTDVK